MKRLFTLVFSLAILISQASNKNYKLGKVTKEELTQATCSLNPEATAYYIFDIGELHFEFDNSREGNWVLKFERKFKIKVLNKEGLDEANFIIPIEDYGINGREKLIELKGRTYNLESGKVEDFKLEKENISDVEVTKYLHHIKYAMPQVKSGSIIEVKYVVESDFTSFLFPWEFQKSLPVLHSEYDVIIPEFFHYNISSKGYLPIHQEVKSGVSETFSIKYSEMDPQSDHLVATRHQVSLNSFSNHTFYSEDSIPAFVTEPFMSSPRNYLSSLHFQLASVKYEGSAKQQFIETWENLDHKLNDNDYFGRYAQSDGAFKQILDEMFIQSPIPAEILQEIYYKLKNKVKWDGRYDLLTDKSPMQVWQAGAANSAELNLMLAGVLNAAGIQASPVLASTRKHGYINQFNPSLEQLNHVMVMAEVNGQKILLDLTGNVPPGTLPANSLNLTARLCPEKGAGSWIDLNPNGKFKSKALYTIEIDPQTNLLKGSAQLLLQEYAALDFRNELTDLHSTKEYEDEWISDHNGLTLDSFSVKNLDKLNENVIVNLGFQANGKIEKIGDKLLVTAIIDNGLGENPFDGEERIYPIDFGCSRDISSFINIAIPDGYQLASSIKPSKITLPDDKGVFIYQVVQNANLVQIHSSFKLNRPIYSNEDFAYLKQFYSLALEKLNQPLVLTKI